MSNKSVSENLFQEFDPVSRDQWIDKVHADLKGADFNKRLVWRTMEGFEIQPFYMKEDLKELDYLKKYHNGALNADNQESGPRYWTNIERITVRSEEEANKEAHQALHMGVDGIEFDFDPFNGIPSISSLLSNIMPNIAAIGFSNVSNPSTFLNDYFTSEKDQNNLSPADLLGYMNHDPLRKLSLTGQIDPACWDEMDELLKSCQEVEEFKPITVNGSQFLNAGGNAVQEIAFVLNMAIDYIDRLSEKNWSAESIINNMRISMGVGTNYFMEIAKLRALRILFNQIAKTYGYKKYQSEDLKIHCQSSVWTKTVYDPYVNMLRNTTEAMSAVLGGCNSLTIEPFDATYSVPSSSSKRISRNISNLLKEESYFDKVVDPAAGSYYIEMLTDKLVNQSWELFKEIEAMGGFINAFENEIISEKIKAVRDKKLDLTSKRREIFVGTNQYPNPTEYADLDNIRIKSSKDEEKHKLPQFSGAIDFETLRLTTDEFVNKNGTESRPRVYLALLGDNKIMRKARATFSTGSMGCAGFEITEGTPSDSTEEAVKKSKDSQANIVVICGSDDDYISSASDFARTFKADNDAILVLAGYPKDIIDDLKTAGIDEFIHVRVNVVEVLSSFQKKINIK